MAVRVDFAPILTDYWNPRLSEFTITELVGAPRERVFAVFSDLRQADRHVAGIERLDVLTEGPIRAGTEFRETRILHGRRATETMEVTEFEPADRYVVECRSHGTCYRCEYRFEVSQGGTQVTTRFEAHPRTLLARMLAPLGRLMMGNVKRCLEDDIADLRRVAEDRTGEGPGSLK